MQRITCVILLAVALAAPRAFAIAPPITVVETTATVPVEQDGCLDHSVRELGMSAKKVETERRWEIASKYLHSSIAKDGTLSVRMDKGVKETVVRVTSTWQGEPKEKDIQTELEQRQLAMTEKMAQLCGVTKPTKTCTVTAPTGKPVTCAPTPTP